jgi:hypothetical protein
MKRKIYCFDIETVPLPDEELRAAMPEESEIKLGNLKDPAKIEAKREEHRNRFLEHAALSPLTGRIAAIGVLGPYRSDEETDCRLDFSAEEKLIHAFFNYFTLDPNQRSLWIGFNITNFDLPFLLRRAWKLGITPPAGLLRGRYLSNWFIDLAEIWRGSEQRPEPISLDRLGRYLGVGGKEGTGAGFATLLYSDQGAAQRYLSGDLHLTWRIAERLGVTAPCFEPQPQKEELVFW